MTAEMTFPPAEDGKIPIACSSAIQFVPILGALELTRRRADGDLRIAFQTDDDGLQDLIRMSHEVVQSLTSHIRSVSHLLTNAEYAELPGDVLSDIGWLLGGLAALAERANTIRSEAGTQLHGELAAVAADPA